MKIVITGGAGFIGSNIAEVLSKDNANEVIVLDDLSTGKLANTKEMAIKFVNGSITDLELLQTVFKDVDYVLHQAAIPSVPRSINEPIASNNANITGTLNVLVAARDRNVKKVVYASSSSVYGDTPKLPKREDMTPTPLSPYAVTKLTGEHYCNVFNEVYGLKTVALRYFNVYGPKQDPHSDYAAVIPKFVSRVLRDEPPVIYGDGQQTRDFTFVKDVVTANIRAMKSAATGVFNIASGNRITIQELAELVMKLMGKDMGVILEEPRKGDVLHSLADVSKAKAGFGYEPGYRLETGLEETVKWF
ncbi:MAG: UDP-glucose 4-epimerase [Candidatus Methanophagaceae archaeon]|nr:MAG: UDP-glucose 4-epimerase [Methanophagales archaeon]KAF5433289.1 UDP-glucose 4-epimerase [Methanophagales archaeon]